MANARYCEVLSPRVRLSNIAHRVFVILINGLLFECGFENTKTKRLARCNLQEIEDQSSQRVLKSWLYFNPCNS